MKNFKILARACSNIQEMETVLKSFSNFHNNITNKHQKRIQLNLIDTAQTKSFFQICNLNNEISKAINFISKNDTEAIQNCDLFLIVTEKNILPCIEFAFANNLPIMSYQGITQRRLLNSVSSILLPFENKNKSSLSISKMLQMLYFDPHARDFLKNGAKVKAAQYLKRLKKSNQFEKARSVA